jgi:hypothetical protein
MNRAARARAVWKPLLFPTLLVLAACSASETETKRPDKIYQAYGDRWIYSKTEIRKQYLGFASPHGIIGMRNAYRETHVITNSAGSKISIPENLYALQKDGSMKQIECCQYFREQGDLYNIGDKLVFIFDNAREFITDCFIYPSGRPDNELAPPGKRVYGVTVFAEFDPIKNIFKSTTFSAGDNYLPFEYRAAVLRSGRGDLTIEQHEAFSYARRKPFMCDAAAGPTQRAPTELDVGAYQAGATRTLQVPVARPATSAFLERLQGFAERKGFKTWKAGADDKEVSLALRSEEVLIIGANDEELWRLGFYRRMAVPPYELPSEESVDALVREISDELSALQPRQ